MDLVWTCCFGLFGSLIDVRHSIHSHRRSILFGWIDPDLLFLQIFNPSSMLVAFLGLQVPHHLGWCQNIGVHRIAPISLRPHLTINGPNTPQIDPRKNEPRKQTGYTAATLDMRVSINGGIPSHHPFLDGNFHYTPSSYWDSRNLHMEVSWKCWYPKFMVYKV